MAHSQEQAKEGSSGEMQRARDAPATQARGGQLGPCELATWPASPFGLKRRLSEDMDLLFGQLLGGSGAVGALLSGPEIQWIPALEVEERDGKLVVQADLPGLGGAYANDHLSGSSAAGQLRAHRVMILPNFPAEGV